MEDGAAVEATTGAVMAAGVGAGVACFGAATVAAVAGVEGAAGAAGGVLAAMLVAG